ncbi:MAG: hypothetical protein MUD11_14050 [Rhodobacteraceae bacterium]|jgi:hypothetical protein|nr:hypothetical protein [Paracoccaceae bacterium]
MLRSVLLVLLVNAPLPASAACASLVASMCPAGEQAQTMTARFLRVPVKPPAFAVGDLFPVADHSILMNPARYGLPPVDGAWRYYRVAPDVFRVDSETGIVLEVVSKGNRRLMR